MKLAIISIGIPGSGKTTVLKPLAEEYGFAYISRDDIREKFFGARLLQDAKDKVWNISHKQTVDALIAGQSVLIDATFVKRSKRIHETSFLRGTGANRVIGIVFQTPLSVAKEWNKNRTHVVREKALERKYQEFINEPPVLNDGFDALYTSEQLDELIAKELS